MEIVKQIEQRVNYCLWTVAEIVQNFGCWPWIGPILTFSYVLLIVFIKGHQYEITITLSPIFLCLTLSAYWGGLRFGLISLAISYTIAFWLFVPVAFDRFLIVVVVQAATVFIVSALKHKATILDSLDTNISKLAEVKSELDYVIDDYDALSRRDIKTLVDEARFDVTGLLARARGWLELSQRIQEVRDIMDSD